MGNLPRLVVGPIDIMDCAGCLEQLEGEAKVRYCLVVQETFRGPLSMRASLVFCVVDKTNFIFRAFHLVEST